MTLLKELFNDVLKDVKLVIKNSGFFHLKNDDANKNVPGTYLV